MTFEDFEEMVKTLGLDLEVRWRTGGMTGGSCWGDTPYPVTPDEEPDNDALDTILEKVCPGLTYLQYRRIEKSNIVEYSRDGWSEYYGNYTEMTVRKINLRALYDALPK